MKIKIYLRVGQVISPFGFKGFDCVTFPYLYLDIPYFLNIFANLKQYLKTKFRFIFKKSLPCIVLDALTNKISPFHML